VNGFPKIYEEENVTGIRETKQRAYNGLNEGEYFAILIIPETFTKDVFSIKGENQRIAEVSYATRYSNNYLASLVTEKISDEFLEGIIENVTSQYIEEIAEEYVEIQINLTDTKENVLELSDNLRQMDKGTNSLAAGAKLISSKSKKISDASDQANEGAEKIASVARSLADGAEELSEGLDQVEILIGELVDQGILNASALETIHEMNIQNQLILQGQQALAEGTESLSENLDLIAESNQKLSKGLGSLKTGSGTLRNAVSLMYFTVDDMTVDISRDIDDSQKDYPPERIKKMLTMFVSPVKITDVSTQEKPTYGAGFAPYFIQIALWVGALVILFLIPSRTPRLLISNFSKSSITLGKFIVPAIGGALQAIVLDFALINILGMEVQNIAFFVIFTILLSWTFISIMQFILFAFGEAGKLINVILLTLQLTSGGGSYPVQMSSAFFQAIHPFIPMSYGMTGLRELITGGNFMLASVNLLIVLGFFLGFLLLRIIVTKKKIRFTDLHPPIKF